MKFLLILFLLLIILFLLVHTTNNTKEDFRTESSPFDSLLSYLIQMGYVADVKLAQTIAGKSSDLNDFFKQS